MLLRSFAIIPASSSGESDTEEASQRLQSLVSNLRIGQSIVFLLLVIMLLAPIYESFDHWDQFPNGGDDTVLSLLATVAFCGLVLVAGRSLLLAVLRKRLPTWDRWAARAILITFVFPKAANESPPPPFNFSLRV